MAFRGVTLPVIDPPAAGETLQAYGCRVLAFVMTAQCTATLSTEELELADHVYPLAIAGAGILPAAVDRLTAARHLILQAIATRRRIDAELRPAGDACSVPPTAGGQPGKFATLQPAPIRRPPAATAVEIVF
jgi:hypothetical protein